MRDVGRPVVYYPRLARFFGSINASILFSQLAYWQDRTNSPIGIYKTAEELEEETGLSYREQVTARKHLASKGYLIETHKRLEHKIFYRLDFDAIDSAFGEWTDRHFPNCASSSSPNDESAVRGERFAQPVISTESTTESTTESKGEARAQAPAAPPPKNQGLARRCAKPQAKAVDVDRPDGVAEQVWADWLALRKAKRAPVSLTVLDGAQREADKAGMSLDAFLREWVGRGSQGLKAEWLQEKPSSAARSGAETFRERDTRLARERWEQATGQRHPDHHVTDRHRGDVIDITPPPAQQPTFPAIPF